MNKVFIIAEVGVNHNGCLELAFQLVDAAAKAGANAVKFQTFRPELVVSRDAPKADYQISNIGTSATQLEMLRKLALSFDDFIQLKNYCDKVGIKFLSTPFDMESVDFIDRLVEIYKLSSGEITNTPFLAYVAQKAKPIILSTGMSTLDEVEQAISVICEHQPPLTTHFPPLTLLHCTTSYPCAFEDVNLTAMLTMKSALKLPIGYSDHTLAIEVAVAAVALGARVIEKHLTLARAMEGPDHKASLEPMELKQMVIAIRNVEQALGDGIKQPCSKEIQMRRFVRKSLVADKNIFPGTIITREMLSIKRPGGGICPNDLEKVIGLEIAIDKQCGDVLYWDDLR
ncbi:MAG: N-acetylneuraminate synthase [Planctomycetota bacterium]|jgi:N-acetylneuraminate synthase